MFDLDLFDLVFDLFDLEAGRFKFLGENLLGTGGVENH